MLADTQHRLRVDWTSRTLPPQPPKAFDEEAANRIPGAARLPLCGPAVLFTAVAPDLLALRRRLETSRAELD